ncbi:AbfB domain-containing protein [Streptosporangium sp. NPDC003464]
MGADGPPPPPTGPSASRYSFGSRDQPGPFLRHQDFRVRPAPRQTTAALWRTSTGPPCGPETSRALTGRHSSGRVRDRGTPRRVCRWAG